MKKIFSILFALVLVVSLGLATAAPVLADTIINVPGDYPTIQGAINASSDGDTIVVAAGEYDAFLVQEKTNISIISTEGATVTTAEVFSIDVEPIDDAWVMAAVYASENINIEGINFDGTAVSEEEVVGGIAYADSTGSIADLTVANIIGTELGAGVTIVGDVVTSVVDLSGVTVDNSFVDVIILNAEANLNGCTITGTPWLGAGIMVGWPFEDGFEPSTVNIHGCTIFDNWTGISVLDESTVEAHFNNIAGNDGWGFYIYYVTADATNNWWGDASGPYHETLNPDGMGDDVSDNVDFEPWLETEVVSETVTDDTVDATDEADTEVVVSGTATVVVYQYDENPGGDAPSDFNALGKYIDVCVPDIDDVTEIEIRLYYTDDDLDDADVDDESLLQLLWWDGDEWKECSDSGVHTASTKGYSGYMWAKIREDTTPSLDYLQGGEFAAHEGPNPLPQQGCFIATAAYGTDTARELDILREFRDEVLLPNSLGSEFVSLYYKTSPPLADFISQHEVLRTAVRVGLVDPIVKILNWSHALWSA